MRHACGLVLGGALAWGGLTHAALPPEELDDKIRSVEGLFSGPRRVSLPAGPLGRQMRWVIDALNSGDVSDAADRCDPEFLKFISQEELGTTLAQIRSEAFGSNDAFASGIEVGARGDSMSATLTTMDEAAYLDFFLAIDDKSELITSLRVTPSRGTGIAGGGAGGAEGAGEGRSGPTDGGDRASGVWDAFSDELRDLGGDIAFGVYQLQQRPKQNPEETNPPWELLAIAAKQEHTMMNVGSVVHLYLLGALAEDVASGLVSWDEQLAIDDALKSYPSGRMQLEPSGAIFPVRQYALLLMSLGDNTAADHLLHRLGRQRVEGYINEHNDNQAWNTPLLTTREQLNLKLSAGEELRQTYARAEETGQRAMLEDGGSVHQLPLQVDALGQWLTPSNIRTIGWFASPLQVCEQWARLKQWEARDDMQPLRAALEANPGIGLPVEAWPRVMFRGGAEPGVNAGTWMVERSDGQWYCVCIAWNHRTQVLDNEKFMQVVYKAFDILDRDGRPRESGNDATPAPATRLQEPRKPRREPPPGTGNE